MTEQDLANSILDKIYFEESHGMKEEDIVIFVNIAAYCFITNYRFAAFWAKDKEPLFYGYPVRVVYTTTADSQNEPPKFWIGSEGMIRVGCKY